MIVACLSVFDIVRISIRYFVDFFLFLFAFFICKSIYWTSTSFLAFSAQMVCKFSQRLTNVRFTWPRAQISLFLVSATFFFSNQKKKKVKPVFINFFFQIPKSLYLYIISYEKSFDSYEIYKRIFLRSNFTACARRSSHLFSSSSSYKPKIIVQYEP